VIIKFSNLGSIKETELDLRPLTVIIGPNNTNKTYIAYSLYGLWQILRNKPISQPNFHRTKQNQLTWDIDKSFIESVTKAITKGTQEFKERLEIYFQDSSRRLFLNTDFVVRATEEEIKDALHRLVGANTLPNFPEGAMPQLSIKDNVILVEVINDEAIFYSPGSLSRALRRQLFSAPFLLPAERNAFVLTYKLLANRRYKLLKNFQRGSRLSATGATIDRQRRFELLKEQGDILYPEPIEDFWDFLTDLEFQPNMRLEPESKNAFQLLADQIENQLQDKNRTIFTTTKMGGREIKIKVKRGLSIDLYNASSSIKQLAPLLLYLRYRAAENDLLIIDEPEMNLHPESQAKLLEALGILVNLGVKVLLTTHSPYFMAHLNNLVNGDTENPTLLKRQASSLYLKDTRAFLKMDQVSAYEMKKNKLCSLKDADFGIRWDTLSDVSAEIQQKYFEISEKRMASSHGKEK